MNNNKLLAFLLKNVKVALLSKQLFISFAFSAFTC